ncbi:MAG TPA: DUF1311 domain-containing protein [Scandinavium sp.]|jgi:hypothetical protein|uniref:DUF1311 domain-containing protein n=1 Tax=Scandinavium sp. TaxID=2830653 RepID=UPI002E3622A3|nr:DUF1311 domain-containing protein [Scandinavium sp.]HEX4501293.1 DUF1311 domain-containing protein [Scandinavium sp.]
MKKIVKAIIIGTTLFIPFLGAAGLYEGEESEACFGSSPDIILQDNCITAAVEKSNKKVDALIRETSKQIKAYMPGPFDYKDPDNPDSPTIGEVYNQRFLKAQVSWKRYKAELCLAVAGQIPEESLTYQRSLDQCEMNLNKRHMAEIRAMHIEELK